VSNETHIVPFNKNKLTLELRFEGDDYETASVKIQLKATGRGSPIEDSAAIPVKSLFAAGYLIDVSLRRNALMVEQEVLRIEEANKVKGDTNGKKDQAE